MKKEIIKEEKDISLEDIEKVAEFFKDILKDGDVVIMEGNLGFGKTTFVRILSRLMESEDIVSSPSFTLINEYDIILNGEESILRHVDLYRLEKEEELDDIGFKDKIRESGILETLDRYGNPLPSVSEKATADGEEKSDDNDGMKDENNNDASQDV